MKCPWIYTKKDISTPLPTMGELVGYDVDMPQWEGDGELVGVRSHLIVTQSEDFVRPYGYKSNYMSQVIYQWQTWSNPFIYYLLTYTYQPFWQSTHDYSKDGNQVKAQLKKLCTKATAIEVESRCLN
jgi:hypothetical protein